MSKLEVALGYGEIQKMKQNLPVHIDCEEKEFSTIVLRNSISPSSFLEYAGETNEESYLVVEYDNETIEDLEENEVVRMSIVDGVEEYETVSLVPEV